MHATFVTLWLHVMQPLANAHETKWTPYVKRESDEPVHIIAVVMISSYGLCCILFTAVIFRFIMQKHVNS